MSTLFTWVKRNSCSQGNLIDWIHWMADWLTEWLINWLIDWLNGWLNIWLTDWMIDWLTKWMNDLMTSVKHKPYWYLHKQRNKKACIFKCFRVRITVIKVRMWKIIKPLNQGSLQSIYKRKRHNLLITQIHIKHGLTSRKLLTAL